MDLSAFLDGIFVFATDDARFAVFGTIAAVLTIFAFLPYLIDTIAGRTRPKRASWLIWSVLSSIALAGQLGEGATTSAWFTVAQVTVTVSICAMSIRSGMGRYLERSDVLALIAAGIGLIHWSVTNSAVYAIVITIVISAIGSSLTIVKAYRDPKSETLSTWLLAWVAAAFAILSVPSADLVLLLYPIYIFALYATITLAMLAGRARERPHPLDGTC